MTSFSAFFYGTLMHPRVLNRVIGVHSHLEIAPALLLNHTRHKVKGQDYPGVIASSDGEVRGCLVTGLSERDILFLDVFEGSEYTRRKVRVHPLAPLVPMVLDVIPDIVSGSDLGQAVEAETYIYLDAERLDPIPWSFASFVELNARKWYGDEAEAHAREDIIEVDRLREKILALTGTVKA